MVVELIETDIVYLKVEKDLIEKAIKVKKEEIQDDLIKLSRQAKKTFTLDAKDIKIDEYVEEVENSLRKRDEITKLLIMNSPIPIYYHKLPFAVVRKQTDKKKFAELVNEKVEKGFIPVDDLIYKRKPLPKNQIEKEAQKEGINLEDYFNKREKNVLALNPKADKKKIIEVTKEKVNNIAEMFKDHSGNKIVDTLLTIDVLKRREKNIERLIFDTERQLLKLITEDEEAKNELSYLKHYKRISYVPKPDKLLDIPDFLFTDELDVKATLMNIKSKLTEEERNYILPDEYNVYIFKDLKNAILYSEKMASTYNTISYPITIDKVNINANTNLPTDTKEHKTP